MVVGNKDRTTDGLGEVRLASVNGGNFKRNDGQHKRIRLLVMIKTIRDDLFVGHGNKKRGELCCCSIEKALMGWLWRR